ncbi:MAG TPA: hypothetical protein VM911_03375 [Pyrinomonadaceae bacterium]|jgi:hypothetical protein|nr:hypothetical protein [Pyrinomonadaceae bacterium]
MSTLTVRRAKVFFLGTTIIALCLFASFSRLTQAQSPAPQASTPEDPIVKQISAYRTWTRVNAEPQFVEGGRRGRS